MQCNSCKAELPKKAKICPKCGTTVGKDKGEMRVVSIAGFVLMLIASMLPFVQSEEELLEGLYPKAYAFSFMNIKMPVMWYVFIALMVIGIILVVARKEFIAIIPGVLGVAVMAVSFATMEFSSYVSKVQGGGLKLAYHKLPDVLANGYKGNSYHIGVGVYLMIVGLVLTIVGCFIDVLKMFKKDLGVDARFLTNSINQSVWQKMYYYRGFYIMFLPVLVMVLLFNYWPMLGCRYAFTSYIVSNPYYIGLYHFRIMFTNDLSFWRSFRNTLYLSIIKLILNTGAAVIISLLLNEIVTLMFKKTVQTIIYLPHFMSWVVIYAVFRLIFAPGNEGTINALFLNLHLIKEPIPWLISNDYWRTTFFIMNIWKDTGWGTILFLATLSGISPDLYEAAQIDGANRFKRLIYITLPALANTIITVFILNLAKVMNLFESVFVTINAGVYKTGQVLQTYIYYKTFGAGASDYGYSTAVGLFKSFVGMILVFGCNYASKKVRGRGIV